LVLQTKKYKVVDDKENAFMKNVIKRVSLNGHLKKLSHKIMNKSMGLFNV